MLASELGQASLALALVCLPMASRIVSQAPAFDAGVLDVLHKCLRSPPVKQIIRKRLRLHREYTKR